MQVTAKKSVSFPKLHWGITAGQVRDLPEDKDAQQQILAHNAIVKVEPKKAINNKQK
jgi:hypothetical protein